MKSYRSVALQLALLVFLLLLFIKSAVAATPYPTPEQVDADYSDPTTRAAAYVVLLTTANHNGLPEADADPFRVALGKIDPPWTKEHRAFSDAYHAISDRPDFQLEILRKYVPSLAARTEGRLREQGLRHLEENVETKLTVMIYWVALAVAAVPFVFLFIGSRGPKLKLPFPDNVAGHLRFPDELRRIKVLGKTYYLVFDCGQVYDKKEWKETKATNVTQPGRSYTVGDTIYHEPSTTRTVYTTTTYYQYWMTTPDGRDTWQKYTDYRFHAVVGHVISNVSTAGKDSSETSIVVACNHTTEAIEPLLKGINDVHRFPGWWVWGTGILISGLIMYPAKGYVTAGWTTPDLEESWIITVGFTMAAVAVLSPIYILIFKFIVRLIRNFQFRLKYQPAILRFLKECHPILQARYKR